MTVEQKPEHCSRPFLTFLSSVRPVNTVDKAIVIPAGLVNEPARANGPCDCLKPGSSTLPTSLQMPSRKIPLPSPTQEPPFPSSPTGCTDEEAKASPNRRLVRSTHTDTSLAQPLPPAFSIFIEVPVRSPFTNWGQTVQCLEDRWLFEKEEKKC